MKKIINIIKIIVMVVLVNINHFSTAGSTLEPALSFKKSKSNKEREVKPRLTIAERINNIPEDKFQVCGGLKDNGKLSNSPKAPRSRIILGGNPKNIGILTSNRSNKNFITVGNSVNQKNYKMIQETELKPTKKENYTSYISFRTMKPNVSHKASDLKKLEPIFNRLIFDLDNKENPSIAIKQAIRLEEYFNTHYPELYTEVWFSGNAGAHVYVYFQEIEVKHPKYIVSEITSVLKGDRLDKDSKALNNAFTTIDKKITDIYSRKIRAPASRNNKSGLYKIFLTPELKKGSYKEIKKCAKKNMENIPVEEYNYNEDFESLIHQIDDTYNNTEDIQEFETVTPNDSMFKTFNKYFKEGHMNNIGYALIHCFKRANTPKKDVINFFGKLDNGKQSIIRTWIDRTYDTPNITLVGLNKLTKNLEEAGASLNDIEKITKYFKSTNPLEDYKAEVKYHLGNRKQVEKGQLALAYVLDLMGVNSRLESEEWYRFNNETGYEHITETQVKTLLTNEFKDFKIGKHDLAKAKNFLGDLGEPTYNMVQFENGLYDMDEHKLKQQNKDLFTLVKTPYNYNPQAKSTLLKEFFETSLPEYDLEAIFQFVGYLFVSGNPKQKLFWLVGISGAGKSVFGNIIEAIFPNLICGVDFSKMDERFALAPFSGAHLNIVGEVDDKAKPNIKYYKDLSGNTKITIEKKGVDIFELPAEEVPKSIQVCNNIPNFDIDLALTQRFIILRFKHIFRGTSKQKEELDKTIISNPEEMEWLIYNSLEAYKRMQESGSKFLLEVDEYETQDMLIENNNPIIPFLRDMTTIDPETIYDEKFDSETIISTEIEINEFEKQLKEYCRDNGFNLRTTKTGNMKRKDLEEAFNTIYQQPFTKKKAKRNGKGIYIYEGLYWKE